MRMGYIWTAIGALLLIWALISPAGLGDQLGILYHHFMWRAVFGT